MQKTPQTPLGVVTVGEADFAVGEEVRPHQHATWELVYCREGHIRCPSGNQLYEAGPGVVLLTPPHTLHYEACSTAWSCYYILIEAPLDHPWPRLYRDLDGTLASLYRALIREWPGQERNCEEMVALLVRQLDILLQRTYAQDQLPPAERYVRDVERLLEAHFARPISIKQLAHEVGVSPSYLRAQFLRLRGQTPMAYRQALRVQLALALIPNSNLSLEAIASRCGYSSASHLSRSIVRATGKRPGSFRASAAAQPSGTFRPESQQKSVNAG